MPSEMTTLKGISVAAWVKSTSSTLALGGISNNVNYTVPMCTLYTSGWQFGNDAQNGYRYVSGGTIANTNTWHHVCCTVSDTTIITYLDGVQVASGAISGVTTFTSANFIEIGCDHPGGDEYLTGSVNDFRIYDHVLSPLEVKHIAQGLILHYPLNRGGFGQENLLRHQIKDSQWTNWSNATTTREKVVINGKTWAHLIQTSNSGYGGYAIDPSGNEIIIDNTKKYTWSCTAMAGTSTNAEIILWFHWRSTEGGSNIAQNNKKFLLTTNPQRISYTIDPSIVNTSYTINRINLMMGTSGTANNEVYFTDIKFEEGSIATPWCPNSSDELYNTLGLNNNIQYDTSGYGNNGTKVGTFSYNSDTPKYNVSTKFPNNCNTWIANIDFPQIAKNLTFACWCKIQQGANSNFSFIISQGRDNTKSGFNIILNGTEYALHGSFGTLKSGVVVDNTWKHIVGTYNGTTVNIYINGELKNSMSYTSDLTYTYGPALVVGKMAYGYTSTANYFPTNGSISDVRIYATALLAEDIKSLYNNSAYIDNQGNIYGAVYEEV